MAARRPSRGEYSRAPRGATAGRSPNRCRSRPKQHIDPTRCCRTSRAGTGSNTNEPPKPTSPRVGERERGGSVATRLIGVPSSVTGEVPKHVHPCRRLAAAEPRPSQKPGTRPHHRGHPEAYVSLPPGYAWSTLVPSAKWTRIRAKSDSVTTMFPSAGTSAVPASLDESVKE